MKLAVLALVLSLAVCALAIGHRPPLGLTPVGYMPHECIHHAGEGAEVQTHPDGHFTLHHNDGRKTMTTDACRTAIAKLQSLPNGWTAYTYVSTPKNLAFSSYLGTWNVPAAPSVQDQQTLFTFTGLQNGYTSAPPGGISIIQPVLQYGPSEAGGGSYWSIASWYVSDSGAVYSTLQTVSTGDSIFGNMTLLKDGKWYIATNSKQTGKSTSINVRVTTPELWAFVTLEVYSIQSCNDFPKGAISYSGLSMTHLTSPINPKWQTESQNDCNERVTVNSPSSVTLTF
jgi:hypothetical protein